MAIMMLVMMMIVALTYLPICLLHICHFCGQQLQLVLGSFGEGETKDLFELLQMRKHEKMCKCADCCQHQHGQIVPCYIFFICFVLTLKLSWANNRIHITNSESILKMVAFHVSLFLNPYNYHDYHHCHHLWLHLAIGAPRHQLGVIIRNDLHKLAIYDDVDLY